MSDIFTLLAFVGFISLVIIRKKTDIKKLKVRQIVGICFSFLIVSFAASSFIYYGGYLIKDYIQHDVIRSFVQVILVLIVLGISVGTIRVSLVKIAPGLLR